MPSGTTAVQSTGARNANATAATALATPATTFLVAFALASVPCVVRSSRASSSTPAAAPK